MSTQAHLDDIKRTLEVAEVVFDGHDAAMKWLNQPVQSFEDKTPLQLIAAGRTDDLMDYLGSIQSGFVG